MTNLRKNKKTIIIGYLSIILGIGMLCYPIFTNEIVKHKENKKIEHFFTKEITPDVQLEEEDKYLNQSNQYIGILEIPSIDLEKGFYDINNINNDVDKNIEILNGSDMPDIDNGTFILAGHSGSSIYSYFKDLDKLELNDEIYIYYNNYKYSYKLVNVYEVEKVGKVRIEKDINKTTLVLITCKHNTNYQVVFIAELLNKEIY